MNIKIITGAALAATLFVLGGCATKSSVQEAQIDATEARVVANQALQAAHEAQTLADDASVRARRSEEIVDRGFKRSMYK